MTIWDVLAGKEVRSVKHEKREGDFYFQMELIDYLFGLVGRLLDNQGLTFIKCGWLTRLLNRHMMSLKYL